MLKAVLGYFQLLYQSNTTETLLDMHSLMMNSDWEEWKCVLMGPMVLYVTTLGTIRVPLLSADNWDSLSMVKLQKMQ